MEGNVLKQAGKINQKTLCLRLASHEPGVCTGLQLAAIVDRLVFERTSGLELIPTM
jgi:hypothetical protein